MGGCDERKDLARQDGVGRDGSGGPAEVTAVVDPLGRRTTNAYDGAGHVVSTTDALTHTTSYTYTALGAVATVTNAAGATTTYGYDELGRAVSATSPNGGMSTTEYDDAGRVASSTSPGGRTTTYSYDANGNVVLADLPDGEILRAYNSLGQPTLIDYSDTTPDVTIEYDRAGRAKEVSNGSVTAEYEYDLAGRVLEIARGNSTFSYGYDDEGRLVSKQYPDERSETFEWGPGSRLAAMDMTIPVEVDDVPTTVTNTVGYTYDAAGRLVQTARTNGPTTSNTFDAAGQLVGSVTVNGATAVTSQTVQWDAVGLPSQVSTTQYNSTKTVLYGYDVLGQVTSQCSPTSGVVCKSSSPKVTYTYDENGNRTGETSGSTSTVHTYDVDDRLVTSTAGTAVTSYSYGLNGELDSVTSPAGTVQYAYGLDGNLYNAVLADGRSVAMAYDESGNRIQRNVNGVMTAKWMWDTNAALPVRTNETGSSTYRWFEDPQSSLGTAVASVSKDGEPTWLITDFSGTTLTTTKTAGATSSAKFDPYGNILSGSMSQPLQFHGQYKDSVLGLYDMRQRDYNPVTGMFLATDPIPVAVGDPFISRYSYGFNNPLVFTDASGLLPLGKYDYADGGSYRPVNNGKVHSITSQATNPNANHGGPDRSTGQTQRGERAKRPSALPSVVVNCTTEAECTNVSCQRGSAYANTPHTDNTWTEAEWGAARKDASKNLQQYSNPIDFGRWWKDHGDKVLLGAAIVGTAICIVGTVGLGTGGCVALGLTITAATIADGLAFRGMTWEEATVTAIVGVATAGFGGMGAGAGLSLSQKFIYGVTTQGVPTALNA